MFESLKLDLRKRERWLGLLRKGEERKKEDTMFQANANHIKLIFAMLYVQELQFVQADLRNSDDRHYRINCTASNSCSKFKL